MCEPFRQAIINVGVNRRITLPQFINVNEGEQVLFKENKDGNFELTIFTNAPKKKIYAVVIGKESPDLFVNIICKWWGIFIDQNGIILGRQRASSIEYLKKDLSSPDKVGRGKLDNQCGKGLWEYPIILSYQDIEESGNRELIKTVFNIKSKFEQGSWPPIS